MAPLSEPRDAPSNTSPQSLHATVFDNLEGNPALLSDDPFFGSDLDYDQIIQDFQTGGWTFPIPTSAAQQPFPEGHAVIPDVKLQPGNDSTDMPYSVSNFEPDIFGISPPIEREIACEISSLLEKVGFVRIPPQSIRIMLIDIWCFSAGPRLPGSAPSC
jgi:hypothetical protein